MQLRPAVRRSASRVARQRLGIVNRWSRWRAELRALRLRRQVPAVSFDGPVNDLDLDIEGLEWNAFNGHDDVRFLADLCQAQAPREVFEIGTFRGSFTSVCLRNSDARVTTTTIAREHMDDYSQDVGSIITDVLSVEEIGQVYRQNDLAPRVRQLYENSREMDLGRHFDGAEIDLCIIDGCHDEEFVESDTRLVLDFVRPGGTILWHDFSLQRYGAREYVWPVVAGVRRIAPELGLEFAWVAPTNWAMARV